ncbi:hypothetical protein [Flavobacterium granuli]|uniref:hypothetical protein n=1 Tax=Flavobacterium granuli TaxID=280093 RepID=UPI00286D4D04|nr:hypothetical protein [Flavobacterium granuli]
MESQTVVERKIITQEIFLDALKTQNNNQLKNQINSGKYLKDTFLEIGDQKDNLRYFSAPLFYSEKLFNIIKILDFRYLNDFLLKRNMNPFDIETSSILAQRKNLSIDNYKAFFNNFSDHLNKKKEFLLGISEIKNIRSPFELKIRDVVDDLAYFKAKVVLITEMAGQGKTNFLCDFVENFLMKKGVINVFLTGIEINAEDFRKSIIKRIFPNNNDVEFSDILDIAKGICKEKDDCFIITIDGINENYNSKVFAINLELFISDMQEYDFVKIILSCRSEYYQDNFTNLEKSTFSSEMVIINSLMKRNNDRDIQKKLFNIYIDVFKIKYKSINHGVKEQLLSNFLLFRIFCETYQSMELDVIDNIYKEELFTNYYKRKSEQINLKLNGLNDGYTSTSIDIKKFIKKVIDKMIEKKQYVNIVLDEIIDNHSEKEIYIRFLDENILIKRDLLETENNFFSPSEVVNFTFDEFRDFLISDFLVEEIYKKDIDKFHIFLNDLNNDSPLIEGCSTFIFYKSRKSTDKDLKLIISAQNWYNNVFSQCIFNIKDENITQEDKETLKKSISDVNIKKKRLYINLINRRGDQILNINFLFECLRDMNEEEFKDNFIKEFGKSTFRYDKINQDDLLRVLNERLYYEDLNVGNQHAFFELLLYMFLNESNFEIKMLYEKYYFRNILNGKTHIKKALTAKNDLLINEINNFIKRYDITL